MLRVGIIGCGKIADSHALQIQRIAGAEIVAASDVEPLMAKQFCERFGVKQSFNSLNDLLREARPDVVHVTTPPSSHFEITKQCLTRGVHAYVEKPFTLNTQDAETLFGIASRNSVKITAGHDDQFHHAARRLRKLVAEGYLGGPPIHIESCYGYEIGDNATYAKAVLGDRQHWVRALPGQLLQNIISHGIARIAEHLVSDSPDVVAYGFTSAALRNAGIDDIVDELRVRISEESGTTAYFTFSSQMRPSIHQFRIYGPRNGLLLDQDNETLIQLKGKKYKSYAEHFIGPLQLARQYLGNVSRNVRSFLVNDFHMKSGMKYLIESFYSSIRNDGPTPIPYREIILTSRIMDRIFEQIARKAPETRNAAQMDSTRAIEIGIQGVNGNR